jgi:hypothetical protein
METVVAPRTPYLPPPENENLLGPPLADEVLTYQLQAVTADHEPSRWSGQI